MSLDLKKINDSPHLLDILVQMEDVLDSLDLYVFPNWMKGIVIEGPTVRRYWFDFTLRYLIKDLPDPRGAMRLLKHNIRVDFSKVTVEDEKTGSEAVETDEDGNPVENAEPTGPTHWDVKISIPRKLISDMNAAELDFYDEDIEIEDVQDAQDAGMTDETGVHDQNSDENGGANENSMDEQGGDNDLF